MYPHRIRLRGPWECEPLARMPASAEPLPPRCRLILPCRWRDGLGEFAGRVRFRRRFGLPRTLDAFERIWLTFAGIEDRALFHLNGELLGQQDQANEPCEFEVTRLLRTRNELVVDVEAASGDGGLWGEVVLEIRCTAFLRGIQLWPIETAGTLRLRLSGQVVGLADRPLDLYVLVDGRSVLYATVEAGQVFEATSDEIPGGPQIREARLELVNGGVIWDHRMHTF